MTGTGTTLPFRVRIIQRLVFKLQPVARLKCVDVSKWHAAAIVPFHLPAVKRTSSTNSTESGVTDRYGRLARVGRQAGFLVKLPLKWLICGNDD